LVDSAFGPMPPHIEDDYGKFEVFEGRSEGGKPTIEVSMDDFLQGITTQQVEGDTRKVKSVGEYIFSKQDGQRGNEATKEGGFWTSRFASVTKRLSRKRGSSAASAGTERQGLLNQQLKKMSLERLTGDPGMLCVKLGGEMLGTVDDSEYIRLRWWSFDPLVEGSLQRLKSHSIGYYDPTALDVGRTIRVEARTTFASRQEKFVREFGPVELSRSTQLRVRAMLKKKEEKTFHVKVDSEDCILRVGQEGFVFAEENSGVLYQFTPQAEISVLGDCEYPNRFHISENDTVKLSVELFDSDERNVVMLVLMDAFSKDISFAYNQGGDVQSEGSVHTDDGVDTESEVGKSCENSELVETLRREAVYKDSLIKQLRAQLSEADASLKKGSSTAVIETGKYLAQIHGLETELGDLNTCKRTLEDECSGLTKRVRELETLFAEEKEHSASLLSQLDAKMDEISQLTTDLHGIKLERDCHTSELCKMKEALEAAEIENQTLSNALHQSKHEASSMQNKLQSLEESNSHLRTTKNAMVAKTQSLTKDVGRIIQVSGANDLEHVQELLDENRRLTAQLRAREAEKFDLMQENASLRMAQEGPKEQAGLFTKLTKMDETSGEPAAIEHVRTKFMSFKANVTNKTLNQEKQIAQLRQLANSLVETCNEKDEQIREQRFANKMLAKEIHNLEKEVVKWQR